MLGAGVGVDLYKSLRQSCTKEQNRLREEGNNIQLFIDCLGFEYCVGICDDVPK